MAYFNIISRRKTEGYEKNHFKNSVEPLVF